MIRFLHAKGSSPTKFHDEIVPDYGKEQKIQGADRAVRS